MRKQFPYLLLFPVSLKYKYDRWFRKNEPCKSFPDILIFSCVVNILIQPMAHMERAARKSSLDHIMFIYVESIPIQPMYQMERVAYKSFLDILIFPCVVNVPVHPMAWMKRSAREVFRSSLLTQIRTVHPKIQLYHRQLNFN